MINLKHIKQKRPVLFWSITAIITVIILVIGLYLFVAYLLPLPNKLLEFANTQTTKIFDRNGELLYEILQPDKGKISTIKLAQIPAEFINATLSAEDIDY